MNSRNPSTTSGNVGCFAERPLIDHALRMPRPAYRARDLRIGDRSGRSAHDFPARHNRFQPDGLRPRVQPGCFRIKNDLAQCSFPPGRRQSTFPRQSDDPCQRLQGCAAAGSRGNDEGCAAAFSKSDICRLRMSLSFSCHAGTGEHATGLNKEARTPRSWRRKACPRPLRTKAEYQVRPQGRGRGATV